MRASILIPYGIITVVAALIWKFAFMPTTGFINNLTGLSLSWFGERWSAFLVIILTEIWKTTPFMSLLLLAGLTLVPEDLLRAARVDGASAWQRFTLIILPIMKPTIGVALLFRTLDAFRIFDTVFVQTRGAEHTETVSIIGYHALNLPAQSGTWLGGINSDFFLCSADCRCLSAHFRHSRCPDRRGGS